jgi:hypothetical protein
LRWWVRFLSSQSDPCYLVVPNDTLPISTLLVMIGKSCPNVRVVCVQHGLFNSGMHPEDVDGANSDYNLVFDQAQGEELRKRHPMARYEAMGFPSNIERVVLAPVSRVVLVGVGTYENLSAWQRSLSIFGRARDVLAAAGMTSDYRPHPSERPYLKTCIDWPLELGATQGLLGGERRAFVGFCSTLLYEASIAGHVVIILDDPQLPGYSISHFAEMLPTSELSRLPALIESLSKAPAPGEALGRDVRGRFERALARATSRERA